MNLLAKLRGYAANHPDSEYFIVDTHDNVFRPSASIAQDVQAALARKEKVRFVRPDGTPAPTPQGWPSMLLAAGQAPAPKPQPAAKPAAKPAAPVAKPQKPAEKANDAPKQDA